MIALTHTIQFLVAPALLGYIIALAWERRVRR
jgi:hypothetical protein